MLLKPSPQPDYTAFPGNAGTKIRGKQAMDVHTYIHGLTGNKGGSCVTTYAIHMEVSNLGMKTKPIVPSRARNDRCSPNSKIPGIV
jgi:hypothetical protein